MVLTSVNLQLNKNALDIPESENIKLIFRHSLRPSLKNICNPESVLLSKDGEELAKNFGASIKCKIGELHSSPIQRCIQTINFMTDFKYKNNIICSEEILAHPHEFQKNKAIETCNKIGKLRNVIQKMKETPDEALPGLNSLNDTVKKILDYIFLYGNKPSTVDFFCTHDFILAILIYGLFYFETRNITINKEDWPHMLECFIITGTRDSFTCYWRDEVKQFQNFFMI